ncbi:RagB/SusD family nutrient uptake outer membrane protein [Pedobacter changchengzhani]|uniref:RagB/SusD family nutrient uptake outer membrane protein n=1 Tax=Pedobacter changchengzhani TaxID=2529274 RepID=A0A4R5MIL7_9SPHI|nr:RagB/SusD family nutrient uptake outer membrane protein [Pedobacter changchengzhani]TDG35358.1 RagB/SusD family nutrient uptake outer membrane protein [Pedobacter changchengzhani]
MKYSTKFLFALLVAHLFIFSACKKLEKPLGNDVTEDQVFSSAINAQSFLFETYRVIIPYGFPYATNTVSSHMYRSMESNLCDESEFTIGYSVAASINISGYAPNDGFLTNDVFSYNYAGIRRCFVVLENIDRVPDYSDAQKSQIKGECKALLALRYSHMLKYYGGVPLVKKRLTVEDDLKIPRSSVEETVNYIAQLCDEAEAALPDSYEGRFTGRLTKGVAMAIKAETFLYAASPLFNSSTPYISSASNSLVSYGSYDANRWKAAADQSKKVIDWALANGYSIINTGNPFDDYGVATSKEDNKEILLSFKGQLNQNGFTRYYLPTLGAFNAGSGINFNILPQFYKADGTNQTWPTLADGKKPYAEYKQKMDDMEPRFRQMAWIWGQSPYANPTNPRFQWSFSTENGQVISYTNVAKLVKFTYKYEGGNNGNYAPDWAVFRLAEFYLDYAEALNEYSPNNVEAYTALNVIRNRAGLPSILSSNPAYNTQATLREAIHRERAIELFAEDHRSFDVRRWKIASQPGVIGGDFYGFQYTRNNASTAYLDYQVYKFETRFWQDKMYLTPIPQVEVDKGYIIQNPGY